MKRLASLKQTLLWAVSYYLLARLSMILFHTEPSNIALLWLPAGLALFIYFRYGRRVLPAIFTASYFANFSGLATDTLAAQILHTSVSAGADTLFAWLSGSIMRRYAPHGIRSPNSLFTFVLLGCLLPTAIASGILGTNLWAGGFLTSTEAAYTGLAICLADMLGIMLVTPVLIAYTNHKQDSFNLPLGWYVATAITLALMLCSFTFGHWLLYFSLPSLLYIVFGTKTLYVYLSMALSLILYNATAARLLEFDMVSVQRLEILAFSLATSFAVLALTTQQRLLVREALLRKQWEKLASHDPLTKLVNRNVILPMIKTEIARMHRRSGKFCIAMIDLDHFKTINDTFGHAGGDIILVEFSQMLKKGLRGSDTASRFGGEEFLVLFPNTDAASARVVLEKFKAMLATTAFDLGKEHIKINFSAGLAEYGREKTLDDILEEADKHLYKAKHEGRNRICS